MPQNSFFKNNSLGIVFVAGGIILLIAQAFTGWCVKNEELIELNTQPILFSDYLTSGHFLQSTFENLESEFLQMALFILMSVFLYQKGSSESKDPDEIEDVDREPLATPDAPWPVRKGGWVLKLYQNSLSIVFMLLFAISFLGHFQGSYVDENEIRALKKEPLLTQQEYITDARFWFESFQNWQSEFFAVASIVLFTIFLRQKGSPQSKPVDAPNSKTGP